MTLVWSMVIPPVPGGILLPGQNAIFMAGDTILSTEMLPPRRRNLIFPSIGSIRPDRSFAGNYLSNLIQKVTIINPQVILAWAGTVRQIRFVVRLVRSRLREVNLDSFDTIDEAERAVTQVIDDVRYVLRDHLRSRNRLPLDVSVVGFIVWRGWQKAVGNDYQTIVGRGNIVGRAAGNGVSIFEHYLTQVASLKNVFQAAAHFVGHMLLREMVNQHTLNNAFGGFFEMAHWEGKFQKLDKLLTVIFVSTTNNPRPVLFSRFSYQYYEGDLLFARIFDTEAKQSHLAIIPPLYGVNIPKTLVPRKVDPETVNIIHIALSDDGVTPKWHYQWLYDVDRISSFGMPSQPIEPHRRKDGMILTRRWFLDWQEQGARKKFGLPLNPKLPSTFPYNN